MAFLVQVVILVKGLNNNRGGANYDDPLPILKPEGILCFSAMIL